MDTACVGAQVGSEPEADWGAEAFGSPVAESSTHSCQPSGAGPQAGSGCQPAGGTKPSGGAGQFGGGLKRSAMKTSGGVTGYGVRLTSPERESTPRCGGVTRTARNPTRGSALHDTLVRARGAGSVGADSKDRAGAGFQGRVRTSAPSSVTTSVCSNWAVRERSLVTTVQPSSHCSQSWSPRVSIGSMVNTMPTSMTVL